MRPAVPQNLRRRSNLARWNSMMSSADNGRAIDPDLEVSNHPTYASKAYTTALLGLRMRIMF
jgi:hypothetical protein